MAPRDGCVSNCAIANARLSSTIAIQPALVHPGQHHTSEISYLIGRIADPSIADYDERRAKQLEFWRSQNGQQAGDPAKLAQAILIIAAQEPPPRRFIASADADSTADQVVADLKAQIDAFRELSSSLGFDAGTRSESSD